MNKCIIFGRIARDIDYKMTDSGKSVSKFTVAVDRPMQKDKPKEADFINCVAFGKQAETIANYFAKGSQILLEGTIRTGNYTNKEGKKVYTTDIWVSNFEFVGSKGGNAKPAQDYVPFGNMGQSVEMPEIQF